MEPNRYNVAGWLSIIQAILMPLSIVVGIIQGIIGIKVFGYEGPMYGPSDLLGIIITVISIYILFMLKRFINEYYDYREVNFLINLAIIWGVVFFIGGLALRGIEMIFWKYDKDITVILDLSFFAVAMITAGIIDILIGVKLLKIKERMSDLLAVFAYLTLITGILEVSIILSPAVPFLVYPASMIVLGIAFLKNREQVEFV